MEVDKGFQSTEIGVIPSDWKVISISEAFDICNNLRLPISEDIRKTMQGPYPYYGPTKIQDYINEYRVHGEYALIGEDGDHFLKWKEMPMTQLTKGKFNVNNHAHLIKGKHNISLTSWFYFYFKNSDITQHLTRQGAGRYKLSKGTLIKIPCALPPTLQEQTAIATALSDTDALISSLEKLIAKKRNVKQGAMQELLKPKKGWEVKRLGEICDVRDGTHESPVYYDNGVVFITSKNLINNRIDFDDVTYISEYDAQQINQRSRVDEGDILMSMIGTIGNAVLINFKPNFCIKNVALFKPKKVLGEFLIQLISSTLFKSLLEGKLDGGIQKFISLGVLRELSITIPSTSEQREIARILSDMDSEIISLESKLKKYRQIKSGMMQNLLTGKIRLV